MTPFAIDGSATTSEITDFIRNIEVSRARFIGAAIKNGKNEIFFVIERVPPKPTLIAMGAQPPPNSHIVWAGEMKVQSKRTPVQLYRVHAAHDVKSSAVESKILSIQQSLKITTDGKAGPETWAAIEGAIGIAPTPPAPNGDYTNARSEKFIATLLPGVQPYARALFFKSKSNGITVNVISGSRTFAEQDALYAIGRTKPGKTVTDAKGGYSNHNFGIGFDIGVFEGKEYLTSSPKYEAVGVLGQELGLEWGGTWKNRYDPSHFQLRPHWAIGLSERDMLAELRRQFPKGILGEG